MKYQYLHLRENEFYDIKKTWWKKMQSKRVVHDSEKFKTNTKKKKCLSFALTFINIKI